MIDEETKEAVLAGEYENQLIPPKCSEKQFRKNIKNHSMDIKLDQDNHRHIVFSNNGSSVFRFELVTWPGYLTIAGDCGTFTFKRLTDMFCFFRSESGGLDLNPFYWAEKLQSTEKHGGYQEFSPHYFQSAVLQDVSDADLSPEVRKELLQEVEDEILSNADNDWEAASAINYFQSSHTDKEIFVDFWEHRHMEYTYHYIWCLYAIVWGIKVYDEAKASQSNPKPDLDWLEAQPDQGRIEANIRLDHTWEKRDVRTVQSNGEITHHLMPYPGSDFTFMGFFTADQLRKIAKEVPSVRFITPPVRSVPMDSKGASDE